MYSRTTHRRDNRIVRFIAPAPSSRRTQAWGEPGPALRDPRPGGVGEGRERRKAEIAKGKKITGGRGQEAV